MRNFLRYSVVAVALFLPAAAFAQVSPGSTPLSPAKGGTGAAALTAGSIPFIGASGVYSQDNARLFWNSSTHRLGIGTASPAATVDFESPSAVFTNSATGTNPTLFQLAAGSNASPISAITPTVGISRNEATTADAEGGQNAALFINLLSNNTSNPGVTNAQGNALTIYAAQSGTADIVGLFSNVSNSSNTVSGHHYGAIGIFTQATASGTANNAVAINPVITNNSADCTYAAMVPGETTCAEMGIFLQSNGSNLVAAGMLLYKSGAGKFDVGYAVQNGSVNTAAFISQGFQVDPSGNTTGLSYLLDSHSTTFTALSYDGTSTLLSDSGGSPDFSASATINGYNNTTHLFRNHGASVTYASLGAAGLVYTNIAAPSSPASGNDTIWTDSTDLRLHDKNSAGTIGTTVVASTLASHNFVNSISAAGVLAGAQPAIADISGWGTGVATGAGIAVNTNGGFPTGTTASVAAGAIKLGAGSGTAETGLADVATGSLLASGGTSTNPAYCAACTLTTSLTTPSDFGGIAIGSTKTINGTSNGSPVSAYLLLQTNGQNIGIGGDLTPSFTFSFSGQAAQTIGMERETTSSTAGNSLTLQSGGAVSGGSNLASGAINLTLGTATGSGASPATTAIIMSGPDSTAGSGTADRAPADIFHFYNVSGFGTMCASGGTSSNCSTTGYNFQGNQSFTIFNTPTAGNVIFRIAGTTYATLGTGSWAFSGAPVTLTYGTPTISSGACGTGTNGSVSGSNQTGTVTIGAAATTTCTVSFSATLSQAPNACIISPANAAAAATGTTVARVGAPSTTSWAITGSALASTVYTYHCI